MVVGEVPGDREEAAGIDRAGTYVTNVVKATIHPSAILRERDSDARGRARASGGHLA